MTKYAVEIRVCVFVDAEDEEYAAEKAVEKVRSPLIDRDNVEDVEIE